jgi:hypothetical protein
MHYNKETAHESRMNNLITDAHVGTIVSTKVLRVSEPMLDQNGNNIRIVNLPILNEYYANQAQEAFRLFSLMTRTVILKRMFMFLLMVHSLTVKLVHLQLKTGKQLSLLGA